MTRAPSGRRSSPTRVDGSARPREPIPFLRFDGEGIGFWYQATGLAAASACCRYRMGHFAERLRGAVALVDRRPSLRSFRGLRTLVVTRPHLDRACEALLERCRRRGIRLVADFDDLLFDGDPAEHPLVGSGAMSPRVWSKRMKRYREGLRLFDGFTAATEPLCERLSAATRSAVRWIPNGLSRAWIAQGAALYPAWRPGDPKILRYLAGSPSHDADFATVAPTLGAFMRAHREVTLEIVGPVELDPAMFPSARVRRVPRVPYLELPRWLASSWATIAPLSATAFSACKSAIKFLESAAFGTPCIATPNPDVARHRDGGVLLPETPEAWREALESLLDDERRMAIGAQGRAWVDRHGGAEDGAQRLLTEVAA